MIELTEQQQQALEAGPAPRLIDPRTFRLAGENRYSCASLPKVG
jgi:hypothetical protein